MEKLTAASKDVAEEEGEGKPFFKSDKYKSKIFGAGEESEEIEESEGDDGEEEEEESEPVDPMTTLREKCASSKACAEAMSKFEECEQRVKSRSKTEEKCTEEILDFFKCQDYCMAKDVLKYLK